MNVVKEINAINEAELKLGISGASWHDEYKDSAYVFVGGLHFELTEGDVITIFSQYGEVMDFNMPRDKETGKPRGFGFLMYEDQRSTVLAVDNLNGAKVLDKTLRVDHVKNYKQPKIKNEDGEMVEPEEQSLNAKPEMIHDDDGASESSESSGPEIDPEDPMRDYLLAQRREAKALKKSKKKLKGKRKDETPEERRARKARKKEKKARRAQKSDGVKGVEALLSNLGGQSLGGQSRGSGVGRKRSRSPSEERSPRARSRSPMGERRAPKSRPRSTEDYDSGRRDRYASDDRRRDEPRSSYGRDSRTSGRHDYA
ncbi:hypothetical protein HGRIS_010121 [Hohenbuehelia grisea]|uniref:RRM domain-containing protein n=1 Tax=Hohenbuehelia grisea TaxID=104357 RepID=A0ABR3J4T1_9AGAR